MNEEEEVIKPTIITNSPIKLHCLLCADNANREEDEIGEETVSFSGGLIEGPEEYDKIFALLCKCLRIRLTKRNSWDFKKEALPFCPSCLEICRELMEMQEQIRTLEILFAEKVKALTALIISSEGKPNLEGSDEALPEEGRRQVDRFSYFRKQVVRNAEGLGRKRKNSGGPVPTTVSVNSISQKNVLDQIVEHEVGPSVGPRKSTRERRMVTMNISNYESDSDENDDDQEDCEDKHSDMKYDSDYNSSPSHKPVVQTDDYDVKPFLETVLLEADIKQELFFEAEEEIIRSDSDNESESKETEIFIPEYSYRSKRSRKSVQHKKGGTIAVKKYNKLKFKTKKQIKEVSETEEDSDDSCTVSGKQDLDYKPDDSDDCIQSDEEFTQNKREKNLVRKWRSCKTTKKIWYDGIEIFPVDNSLRCGICDTVITKDQPHKNRQAMVFHIRSKHMDFSCSLCDKRMSSKRSLDMHIKAVHEKSIIVPCKICLKPFTSYSAMKRHAWTHQNQEEKQAALASGKRNYDIQKKSLSMQCNQCGRLFDGIARLQVHEETHKEKNERKKHICQICGSVYYQLGSLQTHIKKYHTNHQLDWKKCTLCSKSFPHASKLKAHMMVHTGEKPHKCPECGIGIATPFLLKVHLNMHKDIRPYKCDAEGCQMAFFKPYHLRKHREVYHDKNRPPPSRKQSYRSRDGTRKPYIRKNKRKNSRQEEQVDNMGNLEPIIHHPDAQPETQLQQLSESSQHQQSEFVGSNNNMAYLTPNFSFTSSTHNLPSVCRPDSYFPFSYS